MSVLSVARLEENTGGLMVQNYIWCLITFMAFPHSQSAIFTQSHTALKGFIVWNFANSTVQNYMVDKGF